LVKAGAQLISQAPVAKLCNVRRQDEFTPIPIDCESFQEFSPAPSGAELYRLLSWLIRAMPATATIAAIAAV